MGRYKFAALVLCLVLLSSCGVNQPDGNSPVDPGQEQDAYASGYETGYQDGYRDGLAVKTEADKDCPPEASAEPLPEQKPAEQGPEGFVMISEAVPDAILEIRYYSTYNFVGERIDGYEAPVALFTQEAASALREVSDELLKQGYRLKIYDAYRPQSAVDHFKNWAADLDDIRMKDYFYPDLDKSVLFSQGYISSRSGHSRGSTVDLTLFDMATGKELDMGGAFDFFGNRSHPDYDGLTEEQAENRVLLRDAMLSHGFKGINTEWWHFTLKDEPYPDTYFNFPVAVFP